MNGSKERAIGQLKQAIFMFEKSPYKGSVMEIENKVWFALEELIGEKEADKFSAWLDEINAKETPKERKKILFRKVIAWGFPNRFISRVLKEKIE